MPVASVNFTGVFVHAIADPETTAIHLAINTQRGQDWAGDFSFLRFAGRSRPVAVVGETDERRYRFEVLITDDATWVAFSSLVESKRALCVRDAAGRKMFGVIPALSVTDELWGGKSIAFEVNEIDYADE